MVQNIFDWLDTEFQPRVCNSEEFMYDDMDSQSDRSLPIIYQIFNTHKRSHWCDRGAILDFYYSTGCGKILDFGPGDGWPSLLLAPMVNKVIGVDGSKRRIKECRDNAKRHGIQNTEFVLVRPGKKLPFEDNSFDGITAASSIEQTTNPKETLVELYRVLRPAGRIRISYEALNRYRDDREQVIELWEFSTGLFRLILYNRDINHEICNMYSIGINLSKKKLKTILFPGGDISLSELDAVKIKKLQGYILDIKKCTLFHPSCKTLIAWLKELRFKNILPTHNGLELAGTIFDTLKMTERPDSISSIDKLLGPVVKETIKKPAPMETDPWISAIK